jgi:hypothetical protein
MAEKCKVYNLESFTDEERERVEALINQIEEEKKNKKKWWIMPNFDIFEQYNPSIKLNYFIEEQKDSYSKSRPPLKSDFNSEEEAEAWLNNYLEEESLFKSAKNDIDNLVCNLGHIAEKLQKHEYITEDDWLNCFSLYNDSRIDGALSKVEG